MNCIRCGEPLETTDTFCSQCGLHVKYVMTYHEADGTPITGFPRIRGWSDASPEDVAAWRQKYTTTTTPIPVGLTPADARQLAKAGIDEGASQVGFGFLIMGIILVYTVIGAAVLVLSGVEVSNTLAWWNFGVAIVLGIITGAWLSSRKDGR